MDRSSWGRVAGDHVFCCYAREDQDFALSLAKSLRGRGVSVWVDQWDIPPGADWDQTIDAALYGCVTFLIVLSPDAVESSEVRAELRTALDEKKRIVPVLHKPCKVPRQLRVLQQVDFVSRPADDEAAMSQMVRAVGGVRPDRAQSGESRRAGGSLGGAESQAVADRRPEAPAAPPRRRAPSAAEASPSATRRAPATAPPGNSIAAAAAPRNRGRRVVSRKTWTAGLVAGGVLLALYFGSRLLDRSTVPNSITGGESVLPSAEATGVRDSEAISTASGGSWRESAAGIEMVAVKAGCHEMGCLPGETDCGGSSHLAHTVCVDRFWIGKNELTAGQFATFLEDTHYSGNGQNSYYCGRGMGRPTHIPQLPNYPVVCISWHEAKALTHWLTSKNGGRWRFRLPTEAEWEFACRSGGKAERFAGGDDVGRFAWYQDNSGQTLHPVGTKAPNGIGLLDMSGNAAEFVEDRWDFDAYGNHARTNPIVSNRSQTLVVERGGGAFWPSSRAACSYRSVQAEAARSELNGFRVVAVEAGSK